MNILTVIYRLNSTMMSITTAAKFQSTDHGLSVLDCNSLVCQMLLYRILSYVYVILINFFFVN